MTVKELIEKLNTIDSDSQVLIQYRNADAYGSCWEDLEDFDEDDVKVTGHTVIIDISGKQLVN